MAWSMLERNATLHQSAPQSVALLVSVQLVLKMIQLRMDVDVCFSIWRFLIDKRFVETAFWTLESYAIHQTLMTASTVACVLLDSNLIKFLLVFLDVEVICDSFESLILQLSVVMGCLISESSAIPSMKKTAMINAFALQLSNVTQRA